MASLTPLRRLPASKPSWPTTTTAARAFTTTNPSLASPQNALPADPETLPALDLSALPSQAHADLQSHREIRSLARKAAWEMPLLSSLSKPFVPPTSATPLRWRYTSYMGEQHPAARKVVLEFSPKDLPDLNDAQQSKLCKLAGARFNPSTHTIKMSWEGFETQAQNKRYLGTVLSNLLKEARDGKDTFEDVPLDLRHVTNKRAVKKSKALRRARLGAPGTGFPRAWRMTAERRAELEEKRGATQAQLEAPVNEGARVEVEAPEDGARAEGVELPQQHRVGGDGVVSGLEAIEAARQIELQAVEEPMMVEAKMPLAKGKQGKKEMGQKGRR